GAPAPPRQPLLPPGGGTHGPPLRGEAGPLLRAVGILRTSLREDTAGGLVGNGEARGRPARRGDHGDLEGPPSRGAAEAEFAGLCSRRGEEPEERRRPPPKDP